MSLDDCLHRIPCVQALTTLRVRLLSLASVYPPVATDVKALVNAYAPLIGDMLSLSAQTAFSASSWVQQVAADASKSKAASAIVRSDLGLPPSAS